MHRFFHCLASIGRVAPAHARPIILVFALVALAPASTSAQDGAEDPDHHPHMHTRSELGLANAMVNFVGEPELHYGVHLHYVRTIGASRFGYGAGLEWIPTGDGHFTTGPLVSYRVWHDLSLIVSPGVTAERGSMEDMEPSLHVEGSYGFELGRVHVGPAAEWAWDPEHMHISIGLHIGWAPGAHMR